MTLYIDKVETAKYNQGYDVITYVYYTYNFGLWAAKKCTKQSMINFMKDHPTTPVKTKYIKYGAWVEGEDVRVVDDRYLRTDGNNIKADNLGNL